jgi:hypothetical protein
MRLFSCLPAAVCCLIIGLSGHSVHAAPQAPQRGLHMDKVTQVYGQPMQLRAAVGDPPITRWVYDGYTVYFEHKHVIHSVISRESTAPASPASGMPAEEEPAAE